MPITIAVFMLLAGISVILRLYIRKQKSLPLRADDRLIIAAWVGSPVTGVESTF